MNDPNPDEVSWQWFADAHPHEAYAMSPDRFWRYFQTKHPYVSREQMVRTLNETAICPEKVEEQTPPLIPKTFQDVKRVMQGE